MKILHLEDNVRDAELARELLAAEWPDCAIRRVDNRADCLAALRGDTFDVILSDFSMANFTGAEALRLAAEMAPGVPFIFFSGTIGEERAIEAVRAGAVDYVLKDNLVRLVPSIRRALHEAAERRRREDAERHLRELADIIERASEAIIVTALDGRIFQWNRGAERLFGVSAAEAFGREARDLVPAPYHEKIVAARDLTLRDGEWQGEVELTTRDGRALAVDMRMSLIRDDAGRPKARLTIATDNTEKKKLEQQFLHAQRLESLGLLAAGIAHDLNNVLAPVLMAAPLLRVRATDPADIRMIEILEKSAERGSGLVKQILGFAHSAGGRFQLVQVKHLLRDISAVITASFPKSIVLEEHVPSNLWPVHGNPTQIHQVLLNLCINARDAMLPHGGTLLLRAENRELDEAAASAIEGARPGAFLVLEVGDTGTGIAPDVLAHIWEPFFTTKPQGLGTGLGLSTVRGVVASHGGFIALDTAVGRGTTFRIFLPAAPQGATGADDAGASAAAPGGGELILVVDDEPSIRDTAAAILTRQGYRVLLASDGVEAISLFTRHPAEIQLVLADVNMPNLDGPSLALVLRGLQPGVPLLAMSGLGSGGAMDRMAEFATASLRKPFTADALLAAVASVLRRPAR